MKSHSDQLAGLMEKTRKTKQRLSDLEQEVRQPRLVTEANVPAGKKTRKRVEDAVAVQAKHGDSCFAKRVHVGQTSSTIFGMKVEPPALSCRGDVLVDNGAAASNPCPLPAEMRTRTAAGGLLPAGTASIATRTTFHQPPVCFCPTEEIKLRT